MFFATKFLVKNHSEIIKKKIYIATGFVYRLSKKYQFCTGMKKKFIFFIPVQNWCFLDRLYDIFFNDIWMVFDKEFRSEKQCRKYLRQLVLRTMGVNPDITPDWPLFSAFSSLLEICAFKQGIIVYWYCTIFLAYYCRKSSLSVFISIIQLPLDT